jgi:glutamine---fructose-6-phosphate transaminase (isomerizing)
MTPLSELTAGGPDEMGRDMAGSAEAVASTLRQVERLRPQLDTALSGPTPVVLVGTGMSLAIARAAAPAWRLVRSRTGAEASVVVRESSAAALGSTDGRTWRAGELVIAISKSGTSPETLAAARQARAAGCPVVALTAVEDSPLAQAASLVVATPIGEEGGAGTRSGVAALAALFAIANGDGVIAPAVARIGDTVASWAGAARLGPPLAAAASTWIVGTGTAEGLAQAASILWHEKVRRPAVALTVSEFRHGPIEAVQPGNVVIVVDVDGPQATRASYLHRLGHELAALGPYVVWLAAPLPAGASGIALAAAPIDSCVPSPVTALEALVRLQQLARAAAHAAGTYRDGFAVLRSIVKPASNL